MADTLEDIFAQLQLLQRDGVRITDQRKVLLEARQRGLAELARHAEECKEYRWGRFVKNDYPRWCMRKKEAK